MTDPAVVSVAPRRLAAVPPAIVDPTAADAPAAGDPSSPDAMREIQEVAAAQRLLASDPGQALALVRSGEARPSGYLREERRYIGIVALFKLGRLDEGRAAEGARFLTRLSRRAVHGASAGHGTMRPRRRTAAIRVRAAP